MKPQGCIVAIVLLLAAAQAADQPLLAPDRPAFTILFTAEVHGALLPCDCPLQLLGGVVRRATLIRKYRERGPTLVVDAGGWVAGGLYDEDSDGDSDRDRLRTLLMAQALAKMKYDVLTLGDVEYSFLLREAEQKRAPAEWKDLETALISPLNLLPAAKPPGAYPKERAFTLDGVKVVASYLDQPGEPTGAWLEDPAKALKDQPVKAPGVFRVLLSRLGEEASTHLAPASGADLVINAGRKASSRVAWLAGEVTVANFDYQAQRLGVAEVFPRRGWKDGDPGSRWEVRVRHEPVTTAHEEDSQVAALLAPHLETLKKKSKRSVPIEFWTLPRCPYCAQTWPELAKIAGELAGRVELVPHFLVSKGPDDKLRTMHGAEELAEARVQAAVWRHYPVKFWEWLAWREKNRAAAWEEGAKALGLLRARLAGALASGEADALLEKDYQLSLRRRIPGTPTLVIANRIYDGTLDRVDLLRVLCGLLDEPHPEVCRTVPKCLYDAHCRKRGYIGRCLDAGKPQARCDYSRAAVKVPARVLLEPDALYSNHETILAILLNHLPGLEWRVVDPGSPEGAALIRELKPERLPAYVLDPVAKTEVGFAEHLGEVVEERGGQLLLKGGGVSGPTRPMARQRVRGTADLFAARFSKSGQEAVDVALEVLARKHGAPDLALHDALFWQEVVQADGKVKLELAARGGLAEVQEAALAQAVRLVAPDKLLVYLRERGRRRGSLYWDRALQAAGVEVERVRALAEGADQRGPAEEVLKALRADADLLRSLQAGGDVVLLAENCEVIPVRSREELRYYLELIGQRRRHDNRDGRGAADERR